MPPERMARDVRHRFAVVFVAAVIAIVLAGVLLAIPGPWTERTVELIGSPPGEPVNQCYFVNSSVHQDQFCLALWFGPAGNILNGSFDHGPGTLRIAFEMSLGPCASNCPSSETWTSADGTGQVYWTFNQYVTLRALN